MQRKKRNDSFYFIKDDRFSDNHTFRLGTTKTDELIQFIFCIFYVCHVLKHKVSQGLRHCGGIETAGFYQGLHRAAN